MTNRPTYHCHICGNSLGEPPWGESGHDPTFNICDWCGCEFGYADSTEESALEYRKQWLAGGAEWRFPKNKPADWNPQTQLRDAPAWPKGVTWSVADDRTKHRGPWLGCLIAALVLALPAYVLSVGPAYWLGDHGLMSHGVFNALYDPLAYVYHHYPWTNPFFDWWESVWR
jgi:hypothetical protein